MDRMQRRTQKPSFSGQSLSSSSTESSQIMMRLMPSRIQPVAEHHVLECFLVIILLFDAIMRTRMMNGKVLLPVDSAGRILELLLILEQVYCELDELRQGSNIGDVPICMVEQLCPFPYDLI